MDSHHNVTDTHVNDLEYLKKMEDEHFRLQRQVRSIETDRQHRTMGVHPQFRRHDQLLRVLKQEYLNLVKDLKIASTGAHKKKDRRMKMELRRSLLLRVQTNSQQEAGITLMTQLEELLQRNKKRRLNVQKVVNKKMGQIKERQNQSERRLISTENRLETATLRFNAVQHDNMKIREEIEHMLKDRALFNLAWTKMLKLLSKGKKFLTDLFESSNHAYDQRDEWCSKLKSMQEKGKVDQMLHLQEMRDLQKAFDHEMKLYHFLARKGVIRINKQQEEKEELEKKQLEEQEQKQLNIHLNILSEIFAYVQEHDISKIIEKFQRKEQENFALYEMLTEYCAESVNLERDLKNLFQVLHDRQDWNENEEVKRENRLEKLRLEIEKQQQKNNELRSRIEDKDRCINDNLEKITELFQILDCSEEPFAALLGDKCPPSRWRLPLTFELMTERIKEYLEIVYYYERVLQKKSDMKIEKKMFTSSLKKFTITPSPPQCWTAPSLNVIVPADPCPACVESRWLSRVTEAPEVPFTTEMVMSAIEELANDPAYLRSDRIHPLVHCRVPSSRLILAARYMAHGHA